MTKHMDRTLLCTASIFSSNLQVVPILSLFLVATPHKGGLDHLLPKFEHIFVAVSATSPLLIPVTQECFTVRIFSLC